MAFMLAILVIILFYSSYKKEDEIRKLRKKVRILEEKVKTLKEYVKRYIDEKGENITSYTESNEKSNVDATRIVNENVQNVRESNVSSTDSDVVRDSYVRKEKVTNTINKEDSRNVLILSAGAVFIILAAIVFLISTWNVIPNIIKTVVLVVFIEVFLLLSKFAKEKLKLPNASKAFFYIAMAYIPICLYSISFFKLFGEFLSVDGSGNYLYFTVANLIVSIIYMYEYNKNKSATLLYGSVVMQYLTVLFFSFILGADYLKAIFCLGLFNIIIYMFMDKFENKNVIDYMYKAVVYILTCLLVVGAESNILSVGAFLIIGINYLLLEINESKRIYAILFNVFINITGMMFINLFNIEDYLKELFSLIYFIGIYLVQNSLIINKKKENLKFSNLIVNIIFISILQINALSTESLIPEYLYSVINIILMLTSYNSNVDVMKSISNVMIPIEVVFTFVNFGTVFAANYHYYMIMSILTFVIGELIKNPKLCNLNKTFFIVSHINLLFTFIVCLDEYQEFSKQFIYFIIIAEIYGYSYFKDRKNNFYFKYLDYIFTNLTLLSICECFDIGEPYTAAIPMITTMVIMVLEGGLIKIDKLFKDNFSEIYILISSIISYTCMIGVDSNGLTVLGVLFTGILLYRYDKIEANILFNIVPIIGSFIIGFELFTNEYVQFIYFVILTIAYGYLSIKNKDINLYTFAGFFAIFGVIDSFESEIVMKVLHILYILAHMYFAKDMKMKDIFKTLFIMYGLNIYFDILDLIELNDVDALELFGIIAVMSYISREILKKYVKGIESLEYVCMGLVYLSYMFSADGLLEAFGILIVTLIFMKYSYDKKYGAQFIVNTVAIIVGGLYLTKEFWTSLPWWIYLLGVGSALIFVAVRNEAKEEKEKISIGKFIDGVIDKIENE